MDFYRNNFIVSSSTITSKKKYFYLPDTNSDGLKCRLFTTDFQAVKDAVPTLICIF